MTDDKIALSTLLETSSDAHSLREMIGFAAERLMQLETAAICNAAPGACAPECLNQRNDYRAGTGRRGPERSSCASPNDAVITTVGNQRGCFWKAGE